MIEFEGRCPLCDIRMENFARNLICDQKRYDFPYQLCICHRHGIYVWRGKKNELFELKAKLQEEIAKTKVASHTPFDAERRLSSSVVRINDETFEIIREIP